MRKYKYMSLRIDIAKIANKNSQHKDFKEKRVSVFDLL